MPVVYTSVHSGHASLFVNCILKKKTKQKNPSDTLGRLSVQKVNFTLVRRCFDGRTISAVFNRI